LSPAVEIWFTAYRVFPRTPLWMVTRASSAVLKESARLASASASARER
jgi:hypothetical protein